MNYPSVLATFTATTKEKRERPTLVVVCFEEASETFTFAEVRAGATQHNQKNMKVRFSCSRVCLSPSPSSSTARVRLSFYNKCRTATRTYFFHDEYLSINGASHEGALNFRVRAEKISSLCRIFVSMNSHPDPKRSARQTSPARDVSNRA